MRWIPTLVCVTLLMGVVACSSTTPQEDAQRMYVEELMTENNGNWFVNDNLAKAFAFGHNTYTAVRRADGQHAIDTARAAQINADVDRIKAEAALTNARAASIQAGDNRASTELEHRKAIIDKVLAGVDSLIKAGDFDGAQVLLSTLGMGGSQPSDRPKMQHGLLINEYTEELKVVYRLNGNPVGTYTVEKDKTLPIALLPGTYQVEAYKNNVKVWEKEHFINDIRGEYCYSGQRYDFLFSLTKKADSPAATTSNPKQ